MKQKISLTIVTLVSFIMAMNGQTTGSRTYDFRDGTIITAGKSSDGSLVLSGTYKLHGATYGLNMKVGGKIKIAVPGSSTLRFLGSAYSSLSIEGKTKGGVPLEPNAKATKVSKDLAETFDFVYSGSADTLTFTTVSPGSDLYLPTIEVTLAQAGATVADVVKNIIYYFDMRDGSIIPNQTSLNGNYTIEKGLFKIDCGPSNGYGYNGSTHGSILKTGNKITLKVGGNSSIRIGGCQYSNGTITASSPTGSFDKTSQASKTATCYHQDGATVNFLYAGTAGTVVLDFTGTT